MKKTLSKILSLLLAVCLVLSLAACGGDKKPSDGGEDLSALNGTYDIVMWVSDTAGVKEQFADQVKAFCNAHPGIVINATIEPVGEGEAASQMVSSVEDGADIFCFAQDQISRLMMAGALNKLGQGAATTVRADNKESSLAAASVAGDLYAYPLTADNTLFLYYNKAVIPEDHAGSLESIIADCEAAGQNFSYWLEGSAWYNAAFFFAAGCHSNWTMDANGNFTNLDDDFNSEQGVIALRGMQKLLKSKCYNNSNKAADFGAATPSAALVSGPWDYTAIQGILGDNMGCAPLPSYTVDGKSYPLSPFFGCKLMGVKPQADNTRAAVLQQLALYLSGEECQLQRFDKFAWGPSNKNASNTDVVKSNAAQQAIAAQAERYVTQSSISGGWWDPAALCATSAKEATLDDTTALKAILNTYQASIDGLLSMTDEQKQAWSVIGSLLDSGWGTDFPMTGKGNGVFESEALQLKAGDELKCRQGASWDVNFGGDGKRDGANFVVEADGTYVVRLTVDDGLTSATIELISQ